jgi:hypothetical protein
MKKNLLALLAWSAFAAAQTGPQPLFISNVTFLPHECGDTTYTLQVTASGGTPFADASYTYQLSDFDDQTGQSAEFQSVAIGRPATLTVIDSTGAKVPYTIVSVSTSSLQSSQAKSASMTIDSLPLGSGQGCMTLAVEDDNQPEEVVFSLTQAGGLNLLTVSQAPFKKIFSAFPSSSLEARISIEGDCEAGTNTLFIITFPFPQGFGNAMKTYLFNKYCSCALQSSTVPVTP